MKKSPWPDCLECQRRLRYVGSMNIWVCLVHGQQYSGEGLAIVRGFAPAPPADASRAAPRAA